MRLYELSIALKYIKPNVKQLSSSIISLISIVVISLVVWLIVVFLSVSWGLEKSWVGKLISLTAPVRITPTDAYFNSYYYQIDTQSALSSYAPKSFGEKRSASITNPYDPDSDLELPEFFPKPDLNADGSLKDLIKIAFEEIEKIKGATPFDYARAFSTLDLSLIRQDSPDSPFFISTLKHNVYLGTTEDNSIYTKTTSADLNNLLFSFKVDNGQNDVIQSAAAAHNTKRIAALLDTLAEGADVSTFFADGRFQNVPSFNNDPNPLWSALAMNESPLRDSLAIGSQGPPEPILVPKNFKEAGVLTGDRGTLSYFAPSAEGAIELKMPVIVAGFYDPGIIPLGGRLLLARNEALAMLSVPDEMRKESAGIGIRLEDLKEAGGVKRELEDNFQKRGIAPYFKIETYKEYDYAKDIITQLQSEKNLFSMLALIILLVACSNIISMLIILVNDKKEEIGILRSMGATSFSIAAIFGITGIILGFSGSSIGIILAILTLLNLNFLIEFISKVQGYEMFNSLIYGDTLPNELSIEALLFVIGATVLISLIAGFVPACKACLLKPYEILKAE